MPEAAVAISDWTQPINRANTDRSPKISNVISMKPLFLYNSDGSSGSSSYYRESSEAVRHDNNDGAMVGRCQCL
jgi:hypothetical protein